VIAYCNAAGQFLTPVLISIGVNKSTSLVMAYPHGQMCT
jgi:hypothetical protein